MLNIDYNNYTQLNDVSMSKQHSQECKENSILFIIKILSYTTIEQFNMDIIIMFQNIYNLKHI